MWEKQNSSVEILFSYSDGYTRPIQLRWQDEAYDLGGVQFWYAEHKGNTLVHHYKVGDKSGTYTFQLAMETENLTWTLEKATPISSSRLNVWQNHGLVGAV
jgi:hypothetical protein